MTLSLFGSNAITLALDWLHAEATASPILGGFGLAVLIALSIAIVLLTVRGVIAAVSRIGERSWTAKAKKARKPGYMILVTPFRGPMSDRARAFTEATLNTHLSAFSFSAPFEVLSPKRPLDKQAPVEAARALMTATECDLVLWGEEVTAREARGMTVHGLARRAGGAARDAEEFTLNIPGTLTKDGADMARLLAYAVCREMQPALARPQDFRADKLEPIARRFGALVEAHKDTRPVAVLRQLLDDYAAASLHLGETKKDRDWLERAAKAYESVIAQGRAGDADRWISAKIGLGRAMLSLAELRFDPVRVQEGTVHIRAALEVLKSHPRLRLADQGIAALQKADRMMENRRRFSITWNT